MRILILTLFLVFYAAISWGIYGDPTDILVKSYNNLNQGDYSGFVSLIPEHRTAEFLFDDLNDWDESLITVTEDDLYLVMFNSTPVVFPDGGWLLIDKINKIFIRVTVDGIVPQTIGSLDIEPCFMTGCVYPVASGYTPEQLLSEDIRYITTVSLEFLDRYVPPPLIRTCSYVSCSFVSDLDTRGDCLQFNNRCRQFLPDDILSRCTYMDKPGDALVYLDSGVSISIKEVNGRLYVDCYQ